LQAGMPPLSPPAQPPLVAYFHDPSSFHNAAYHRMMPPTLDIRASAFLDGLLDDPFLALNQDLSSSSSS
jgi:hypothetical protein